MMEILTAAQMREADRVAIVEMKIPGLRLMESAGLAVAREAARMVRKKSGRIAVLCGKGNNGGDGLVAARLLARQGRLVSAVLLSKDFSPDAATQFRRLPGRVEVVRAHSQALWNRACRRLETCALVIDAIFCTGLGHPLGGLMKQVVDDLNRLSIPVLAVDIPSGVDATTGRILGAAVRASVTVTFARPKLGHILFPGAAHTGRRVTADIGIPDTAISRARPDTYLIDRNLAARLLPPRPDDSHKGTYGRSVILAGSRGMIGAAVLAAEAAMRIGSGLTRLCVPASVYSIAARKLPPEAMCAPVSEKSIAKYLNDATAVLIGPGLGRDPRTLRWVGRVAKSLRHDQRCVLDADALFALAALPPAADTVLTPHAGEMARLIGKSRAAVEADSCAVARSFARRCRLSVVLKGSRTKIADRYGDVYVNPTGNAALAKGATGDVLVGLICGLAAQGLSAFDAARLAVYLHGRAADLAVEQGRDKRTFLASDIFKYLDAALLELSG